MYTPPTDQLTDMDMRFTCVEILSQMHFVQDFLSMLGSTASVEMAGKPCLYRCLCSLLVCAAMVSPVTARLGNANSFILMGILYMVTVWLLSSLCGGVMYIGVYVYAVMFWYVTRSHVNCMTGQ